VLKKQITIALIVDHLIYSPDLAFIQSELHRQLHLHTIPDNNLLSRINSFSNFDIYIIICYYF